MSEEQVQSWLCQKLQAAQTDPLVLSTIGIVNSTSQGVEILSHLIGGGSFEVICDNSKWNNRPGLMVDIAGGVTPDIVLRSNSSNQNRVIVEVKVRQELNYGRADSQALRYFLWLLAITEKRPSGKDDIRRAVLIAAPGSWCKEGRGANWRYFVEKYAELAQAFDITLGEIHCDGFGA